MQSKTIYALWNTGPETAPPLVQKVFESWRRNATGYEIIILDQTGLDAHLAELGLADRKLTVQAASDILRTKLLLENGGIWLDATCLLSRPIDNWIVEAARPSGFFAFTRPGADRLVASWCLATTRAGHPALEKLLASLVDFWSIDRRVYSSTSKISLLKPELRRVRKRVMADSVWGVDPEQGGRHPYAPYFFFHYLFEYLTRTDEVVQNTWEATPKFSALPALTFGQIRQFGPLDQLAEESACSILDASPVHKLNWRIEFPSALLDRALQARPAACTYSTD